MVLGRDLNQADFDRPVRNAVVNETFVRKYLAGGNPVGQTYYPPKWDRTGASHHNRGGGERCTLQRRARRNSAHGVHTLSLAPGGRHAWCSLSGPARRRSHSRLPFAQAVASVDPHLPVAEMRTEREQIDQSLGSERLFAALVTAFGVIALVLAAIGLYGIMAFSVSRRTSEIGLRLALGARRRRRSMASIAAESGDGGGWDSGGCSRRARGDRRREEAALRGQTERSCECGGRGISNGFGGCFSCVDTRPVRFTGGPHDGSSGRLSKRE